MWKDMSTDDLLAEAHRFGLGSSIAKDRKKLLINLRDRTYTPTRDLRECRGCYKDMHVHHQADTGFRFEPQVTNETRYIVYGAGYCHYCANTIQLLYTNNRPFTYYPVGINRKSIEEQEAREHPFVPLIFRVDTTGTRTFLKDGLTQLTEELRLKPLI